jgi:hypothetical protein
MKQIAITNVLKPLLVLAAGERGSFSVRNPLRLTRSAC